MELVVRGRGDRVTGGTRERVERKLARLVRLDPRLQRVELEVTWETRGRIGGGHRVEAACRSGRRTYRAAATGADVEAAVDRLVQRLQRQIVEERGKRRSRMLDGANRVKSAMLAPRDTRRRPLPGEPE